MPRDGTGVHFLDPRTKFATNLFKHTFSPLLQKTLQIKITGNTMMIISFVH